MHPNLTQSASCPAPVEEAPVALSQKEREHRLNRLIRHPQYNPHERDTQGWNALHYAAYYNDAECITILIEGANADATRINDAMRTPLEIAILNNHKRAAFCLLRKGGLPSSDHTVTQIETLAKNNAGWDDFVATLKWVKTWTQKRGKAPGALLSTEEIKRLNSAHRRN